MYYVLKVNTGDVDQDQASKYLVVMMSERINKIMLNNFF